MAQFFDFCMWIMLGTLMLAMAVIIIVAIVYLVVVVFREIRDMRNNDK